ncbi:MULTISPECIES: flagellar motor switch phosphatase FliY [Halanaerobium]|jgi:flagellar motor switch protein FliN/FliY|uniref:Flagellar motor switch protein FliN/FliY n=1 Tax=Halanaerobium congolense TaxID=54121 RepID=A0A4R8G704_9FIRM|nr:MULTISPECIES: flagellar motor switch phosphatase FliY [Halanaerobium]KXS49954.1 MAG: flagellar motor switch protein FliN/FliY [Halanaerobium sp. T82-1]PUU92492.1 MAG: Flagellar motor switch protein FliN [Halanaerobium sp.]TDP26339.1 flagellar motor switch protein FliN/FliY [Halanaerobium congolense]TDS34721.1 flagellar motor switch protein FliN/FliY [Halanaerobium congolense]TDX38586.1 flagellar motor switch protein FliN/FliY [Halanaerobium congolense]
MTNDGNFLSQEEIDALMNGQDDENNETEAKAFELTPDEIDVIGEVNNIAMGSSATALSTLLDQKVDITTPEVELMSFQKLIEDYDRPCVLVKVEYVEGIEGLSILVLNTEDAAVIADLMMGGDGLDGLEREMLNEISISAVGEAMNQMMGAASTAMSNILDRLVNISPPEAEFINLDDVMEDGRDWFDPKEEIVVTSFNLKIGDLIDSTFKQLSSYNFVKNLAESLLTGQTGLMDNSTDDSEEAVPTSALESESEPTKEKAAPKTAPKTESASKNKVKADANSGGKQRRTSSRNISPEEKVDVHSAQFPEFSEYETQPLPNNMELIKDVPLEVTVRLGKTVMKIRDILELGDGSIIELDKLAGEPVDLLVNGKLVAKGEVVVIDENFGFRVKDIVSPTERLKTL